MGYCDECSADEGMPYICNECGGTYCSDHRLPEAHDCQGLRITHDVERQTTQRGQPTASRGASAHTSSTQSGILGKLSKHSLLVAIVVTVLLVAGLVVASPQAGSLFDGAGPGDSGASANPVTSTESGEPDAATTSTTSSNSRLNADRVEVLVHERINEVREERGLQALTHDSDLRKIASGYSKKMATEDFFAHESPSGDTFQDRYEAAGYQCRVSTGGNSYTTGGENILYTYAFIEVQTDSGTKYFGSEKELAKGIVQQWTNSEGHRENILRDYWQNEGIGVYTIENPNGPGVKVYATQNFC